MTQLKRLILKPDNLHLLPLFLFWGALTGILPFWRNTMYAFIPATAGALLSLAITIRRLRGDRVARLRRENGLCAACGYDLRATPDGCLECGPSLR